MPSLADAALLILGHGSTQNAESALPTHLHALEICRRRIFKEVHVAFWKEEPNFRAALRPIQAPIVFIVPNFISEGYFTQEIIPRELSLTPPITRTPHHTLAYCTPVGLHPSMTQALLQRAAEIVSPTPPDPAQTALFIVGHGTSLNENSTQIIYRQAHIIRQKHIYAEVHAAFMEEAPYIKDWPSITSQPNVIVVPFFIADGLHSYEDIPVLLGMTDNVRTNPFRNPHTVGHRRLWYARAIGTHPFIADVILASVQSFIDDHPEIFQNIPTPKPDALSSWIASLHFPHRIGQLTIHKQHSHYLLTHHHPTPPLKTLEAATTEDLLLALLRLSKKSPSGEYRYLTTSPDLPTDWQTPPLTLEQLISALQILHPNALIDRYLYEHNLLPITPIHHTTSRQTGMYRRTSTATPHHITQAQKKICHKHCSKIPLWHPDPPSPSPPPLAPHHIPCPEACNAYISTLRETLLNETPTPQPSHT